MIRYLACAQLQMRIVLTYRAGSYLTTFLLLVQIYLLKMVWTSVYAGQGEVAGVSLYTTLAYITLARIQFGVLNPIRPSPITGRVREGKVAVDLIRPVAFPAQMLACQLGSTAATLLFVLPAVPFAMLIGVVAYPASATTLLVFVLSLAAAVVVNQLLLLLLGMVAFWTLETAGVSLLYRFLSQFFAGALVPLWFMPDALRSITEMLPFYATSYLPIAIYLGRISTPEQIYGALGAQLLWIAILSLIAAIVWSRAIRRVVIQGG